MILASAVFVAGIIAISGCKKEDTTPPVITLKGNSSMPIPLNTATSDPGATASDDKDGDLTSKITSTWSSTNPNVNKKGTYTITYTVNDAAGNTTTATRTVNVVNDAEAFVGTYANSVDSCVTTPASSFTATVTSSDSINKLVKIANFGAFGNSIKVFATISGTTITVATNQSLGGNAYIQNVYTPPTGVISSTAPTEFRIKYQWTDGTNSDVCNTYYKR